ncbi:MAG: response regulator transcription factor [Proteobacteria bacterium]|nr:response regulator transcription factor [Pseudomonadota bacterium]MBI3497648.1 response regulator transcription factor [Pseudomonadota bacterium]
MSEDLPHLLVVDDDTRLRELLRRYLGDNGFRVTVAADAAEARARLASVAFDLIVLDVMMPGESGIDLTRDLSRQGTVPILLLTAMGEIQDRIAGLGSGADDYLAKPFEPQELVLRLKNILRRARPAAPRQPELRFGAYRFDPRSGALILGDTPIRLTEAELSLLMAFARRPGEIIGREELADRDSGISPRTVDVQITRLRRKIEADPKFPRYLQTVRGKGYVLRID